MRIIAAMMILIMMTSTLAGSTGGDLSDDEYEMTWDEKLGMILTFSLIFWFLFRVGLELEKEDEEIEHIKEAWGQDIDKKTNIDSRSIKSNSANSSSSRGYDEDDDIRYDEDDNDVYYEEIKWIRNNDDDDDDDGYEDDDDDDG